MSHENGHVMLTGMEHPTIKEMHQTPAVLSSDLFVFNVPPTSHLRHMEMGQQLK